MIKVKADTEFVKRQIAGFEDNIRQKMLEIQMNAWAMAFSSGMLECIPCFIDNDEASALYCYMAEQVGVREPGECQASCEDYECQPPENPEADPKRRRRNDRNPTPRR